MPSFSCLAEMIAPREIALFCNPRGAEGPCLGQESGFQDIPSPMHHCFRSLPHPSRQTQIKTDASADSRLPHPDKDRLVRTSAAECAAWWSASSTKPALWKEAASSLARHIASRSPAWLSLLPVHLPDRQACHAAVRAVPGISEALSIAESMNVSGFRGFQPCPTARLLRSRPSAGASLSFQAPHYKRAA